MAWGKELWIKREMVMIARRKGILSHLCRSVVQHHAEGIVMEKGGEGEVRDGLVPGMGFALGEYGGIGDGLCFPRLVDLHLEGLESLQQQM